MSCPSTHARRFPAPLAAAGVDTGEYDDRIISWLAGWEPETVAVIAGLIGRAYEAGREAAAEPAGGAR